MRIDGANQTFSPHIHVDSSHAKANSAAEAKRHASSTGSNRGDRISGLSELKARLEEFSDTRPKLVDLVKQRMLQGYYDSAQISEKTVEAIWATNSTPGASS